MASLLGQGAAAAPLGRAYERSLGARPSLDGASLSLRLPRGRGRKARGSYYSPPELVERLLDAALEPLLDRARGPDALLSLRLCDPSCGAGNILLAAARRLARRLPPGPSALLAATGCLYGVDLDPTAALLCRHALWQQAGGEGEPDPALAAQIACGDALLDESLRWPERFAGVFERGGFDAVLGNPPFLNAIEALGARGDAFSALARERFQPFARGAYDLCLLFWARTTLHLLRPGGTFGMFSPVSLLSQARPWQRWMHERFRPRELHLYPPGRFPGANVRVAAIIGEQGASPWLRVCSEVDKKFSCSERPWPQVHSWYEAACVEPSAPSPDALAPGLPTLARVARLSAGCVASAAYELSPLVVDGEGQGPWLVTTGALDRYRCRWGQAPVRFLKRLYKQPRWPEPAPPALARAALAQRGPKILVGGLTAVVEAWCDAEGVAAGAVATWVVRPLAGGALAWLKALTVVLNSATFSRIFVRRNGGASMSGRQLTVKKQALLEMPVPAFLQGDDPTCLADLHDRIAAGEPGADAEGHLRVASLYGRGDEGAADDLRWWCERARQEPPGAAELLALRRRVLGSSPGPCSSSSPRSSISR